MAGSITVVKGKELILQEIKLAGYSHGLPASIPLAYPDDCKYDPEKFRIEPTSSAPVTSTNLVLAPEALQVLRSIEKPVAVISICGPYRSGKSYFMSRVLGCKGTFKLGHTAEACTRGIWLSTHVLECKDFVVVFLDTEGAGAVGKGQTSEMVSTSVLTLTTLLSSLLIYNTSSPYGPKQEDILRLKSFIKFAESILKAVSDRKLLQKHTPEFLWLLRDIETDFEDEENEEMEPTEYVKYVLKKEGEIGSKILSIFPTLKCIAVSSPSCSGLDSSDIDEKQDCDFNKEINSAIELIKSNVKPKRAPSNTLLTGSSLASLANEYAKALSEPDSFPDLEDSWMAVVKSELITSLESLVNEYNHRMSKQVTSKLPMEQSLLMLNHRTVLEAVQKCLSDKILSLMPRVGEIREMKLYKEYAHKLTLQIVKFKDDGITIESGELLQYTLQNEKKSRQHCNRVFEKLNGTEGVSLEYLIHSYHERAVGPARYEVYNEKIAVLPEEPKNVRITSTTPYSITVEWYPPLVHTNIEREYHAQISHNNHTWSKIIPTKELKVELNGLKPATKYKFRIRAVNKSYYSRYVTQNAETYVAPPSKPKIEEFDPCKLILTFKAPKEEDEHGSPVISAIVEVTYEDGCCQEHFDLDKEKGNEYINKQIEIRNITHNKSIELILFWLNSAGLSEPSEPLYVKPTEFIPGLPTELRKVGRKHDRIKIRYAPPDNNPAAVAHYLVGAIEENNSDVVCRKRTTKLSALLTNLKSNTEYRLFVCAVNEKDQSFDQVMSVICETKVSKAAAALAGAGATTVGVAAAPLAGAAIVPVASTVALVDGVKDKSFGKIFGGIIGLISTPITAPLGLIGGLVTAPAGGIAGAVGAKLLFEDSDEDIKDSDEDN